MEALAQLRAGRLAGATRLDLPCGLTEFPREVLQLADTLELLNLSGNALTALPEDFPTLHRLRILFCPNNRFARMPSVLGRCPRLRMVSFRSNGMTEVPEDALPPTLEWLILTDNALERLPDSVGDCAALRKLMLSGNRLRALPASLANCERLELVRLAANRLEELPPWLLELPQLAWLGYSGNPVCDRPEASVLARHPIPAIPWDSLQLGRRLGEGASGEIFQAEIQRPTTPSPDAEPEAERVAVKLFRAAVTSDGLPHSEMDACITAGTHPNLIPVLGKVTGHPTKPDALVMALVSPEFSTLAGPPSFDTCTRDVYAAGAGRLPAPALLAIARGVAAAVRHLHRQGVLHGDLYAHNVLHTDDGRCLLGDFGAASFFEPTDPQAEALQRLEARAFGHLLEELVDRGPDLDPTTRRDLRYLCQRCGDPEVLQRPTFTDICDYIDALDPQ
eukprot:EG_transcript_9168